MISCPPCTLMTTMMSLWECGETPIMILKGRLSQRRFFRVEADTQRHLVAITPKGCAALQDSKVQSLDSVSPCTRNQRSCPIEFEWDPVPGKHEDLSPVPGHQKEDFRSCWVIRPHDDLRNREPCPRLLDIHIIARVLTMPSICGEQINDR